MTYTYNDQAIFQVVAGAKAIVRRPIGMPDKKWIKYAEGVVKALDNRAPCTPLERGEALHKAMLDGAQESPSMKLVDILARELKVWPFESSDGVGQAATGQLHSEPWVTSFGHTTEKYTMADDFEFGLVTRAEWQAAVDALNAPMVADGNERLNMRLGAMIDMGWLEPVKFDISTLWPRHTYKARPPGLCSQMVGRASGVSTNFSYTPKAVEQVQWDGEG